MTKETDETISDRIARILADRIISGAIRPGARLRQDHVAAEFGASHVPVREAFRALQKQGLAESEPWRGFRVTEMRASLESLARILMPASVVRLSAGRTGMSDELQALCFFAGANSIFVGDQLLTTGNPAAWKDHDLLQRLGMHVAPARPPGSAMAAE